MMKQFIDLMPFLSSMELDKNGIEYFLCAHKLEFKRCSRNMENWIRPRKRYRKTQLHVQMYVNYSILFYLNIPILRQGCHGMQEFFTTRYLSRQYARFRLEHFTYHY